MRHYSIRAEESYLDWARRYILFHEKRHPKDMGADEVQSFLSYLAAERQVFSSTQNQARSALLFLYRDVLHIELPWLDEVIAAIIYMKPVCNAPSVRRRRLPRSTSQLLREWSVRWTGKAAEQAPSYR